MCDQRARSDLLVAEIAARQHGVVTVRQLRDAGLDKHRVRHRVRTGRLHRVHRGVYAVGHPQLSREGRWAAAVLACGDSAVLSHRSAASLWGLLPSHIATIDVSVPGYGGRQDRAGIRLHRSSTLGPGQVTRRRGISVTTPERTISDLRRAASPKEVRRAIRQAEVAGVPIGPGAERDGTRSELEFHFLRLCQRFLLPVPEVNVQIGPFVADFVWRDQRLIVETDGYRYHRGRTAFEEDRVRDLKLRTLGYDVVRLSYRQVLDHPEQVATVLRDVLRSRPRVASRN